MKLRLEDGIHCLVGKKKNPSTVKYLTELTGKSQNRLLGI